MKRWWKYKPEPPTWGGVKFQNFYIAIFILKLFQVVYLTETKLFVTTAKLNFLITGVLPVNAKHAVNVSKQFNASDRQWRLQQTTFQCGEMDSY